MSRRGAALLRRHGISQGDRVLIFQPMSAELYGALIAVFRVGAVAMFLDPATGIEHMEQACRLVTPAALIATRKAHLLRLRSGALRGIGKKFSIGGWVPGASGWPGNETAGAALAGSPDAALITFTSGSTGEPKGAVRTHDFLLAQHRVLERTLELREGAIDLTTLPVFVLANLASGVVSVIPGGDLRRPGEIDGGAVGMQIQREGVQSVAASPALLERVAGWCENRGQTLPSLGKVFAGGAPVFPPLLQRLRAMSPKARITSVYGSTEAEPICELDARDVGEADLEAMRGGRGLLAGRPVDEIEVRVIAEQWGRPIEPLTSAAFDAISVPAGTRGEITVSGEHVLSGYLNGRGDSETKFNVEGRVWHRTGDSGYFDASGRVWMLGRTPARIADAAGVLYPFAVECALSFVPELQRSAILSHEGRRLLFVEYRRGASRRDDLAGVVKWAAIDEIRECSRIPVDRRHNAKIDYAALARLAGDS